MTNYTKLDCAEAHICTAVRLYFEDRHPIPIQLLAASAREILTTVGGFMGVQTILHNVHQQLGPSMRAVEKKAMEKANFVKHADRDPTGVLDDLDDADNTNLLLIACHDFGRVAKGMPVEAQVFEAWFHVRNPTPLRSIPLSLRQKVQMAVEAFPYGLRTASLAEAKRIGLERLERAVQDPSLKMSYSTVVTIP